jgi:predicted transglutaminase-like cysteine proteinase
MCWSGGLALVVGMLGVLMASGNWESLLPDGRTLEVARARFGPEAAERLLAWAREVRALRKLPEQDRLERINRFFNALPNVDDATQWGQRDYWATPVELLVLNGGDCEDFALAKYFSLKAAGVPVHKLRITYVRALLRKPYRVEAHMVLAYHADADSAPLILDNLMDDILPAPRRADLTPTMSFNAEGLWSARQRSQTGKTARVGDLSGIRHWNDLLARMGRERSGSVPGGQP